MSCSLRDKVAMSEIKDKRWKSYLALAVGWGKGKDRGKGIGRKEERGRNRRERSRDIGEGIQTLE